MIAPGYENVIRDYKNAYHKEGGIAVLKGNLAPEGSVIKQTAVSEKMMHFKGKAKAFDSEEAAMAAIMAGKIPVNKWVVAVTVMFGAFMAGRA